MLTDIWVVSNVGLYETSAMNILDYECDYI